MDNKQDPHREEGDEMRISDTEIDTENVKNATNATKTLVTGIGLGAAAMYLLDPTGGKRRRALVRDKTKHLAKTVGTRAGKTGRDLRNRAQGTFYRAKSRFGRESVDDDVIGERVRARMGRLVTTSGSVDVEVEDGVVTLEGLVYEDEERKLVRKTAAVRGVRGIENRLDTRPRGEGTPSLGGESPPGTRFDFLQRSWSPATRALVGTAGGAAAAWGFLQRTPASLSTGGIGTALFARALVNRPVLPGTRTREAAEGVGLQKTINVEAPINQVYRLWSHPETFPLFSTHLKQVQSLGEGRYRWIASGPSGTEVAWEAQVVEDEPNHKLAWRTLDGSAVESRGTVELTDQGDDRTRVHIDMHYTPPGRVLGHTVARLLRRDPRSAMDEDLLRMKSLLENGKTTNGGRTVELEEVLHSA